MIPLIGKIRQVFGGKAPEERYDAEQIQQLENEVARAMVTDKMVYHPSDPRAELQVMRLQLTKIEYMLAFLLGSQVTEMVRSPRPGEAVEGDPATTKIKYQRSALQEWHSGPWKKYLESALQEFQPIPEHSAPPPQAGQPEGGTNVPQV